MHTKKPDFIARYCTAGIAKLVDKKMSDMQAP